MIHRRYNMLRWLSRLLSQIMGSAFIPEQCAGVAELADAPDLGSGAKRRMGSSPFARTTFRFAVVAQLVERHLAKVEVASPSLVYRSSLSIESCGCNSMVEFQPSKLATWVRFPSPAPM